jgi:protein-tyrosine phosphatase
MAEMAVADGVSTIVVTPHQLGAYAHNDGSEIRQLTQELQQQLQSRGIPLEVLPGADVRIDETMMDGLRHGTILTLADAGRHVLLELPHELYFPLQGVLSSLRDLNITGILSHPERNQGLLKQPGIVPTLIDQGCLMQVTAGSLMGTFGPACQEMAEWMVQQQLAHFLASDAHGVRSRRPLLGRAFERVMELVDEQTALDLCCRNPASVAAGRKVTVRPLRPRKCGIAGWFNWRKAG